MSSRASGIVSLIHFFCLQGSTTKSYKGFSPFELLYGRTVRGPIQIPKEQWSKEENVPEVTTSYQYVLELGERLNKTMKLAQTESERNRIRNKRLYNRKAKKRVFQVGDKVLVLLPSDHNKLLMQWKGPFEIKGCKGGNNYQTEINRKMKTFHINLLKQYVKMNNVEMAATPGRRDFPGNTREETQVGTGIEVQGVQGGKPQAAAFSRVDKNVVGTSADYVGEQENVGVDDEKLLELEVLRPKESISDICLEVELRRKQHNEIIGVLSRCEEIFTDIPGKTSVIEHRMRLIDDCPIRCRPYALPYAVRGEIQEEIPEMINTGIVCKSDSPYASPMVVVKKNILMMPV